MRCHGNLVSASGQGVREVQNMTLLASDIGREKLGEQQEAH